MMAETRESLAGISVSRETLQTLDAFSALVQRWNSSVNLVSKSTLLDMWTRHILDSAQLFALCPPKAQSWLDLGSGGGFPGLVIAILAREKAQSLKVSLVEADLRKAAFLREAARILDLHVSVHSVRIESLASQQAQVLSARALAPLGVLLAYAEKHLLPYGSALFPKGSSYAEEIEKARKFWQFDVKVVPSLSEPNAAILDIRNIRRAKAD